MKPWSACSPQTLGQDTVVRVLRWTEPQRFCSTRSSPPGDPLCTGGHLVSAQWFWFWESLSLGGGSEKKTLY